MKFPRKVRLTRQTQFRDVFAKASVSRDRCFRVLGRSNQLDHSRLGLAVSKRNCRLASDRNRIKRVIRESFRHHQAVLSEKGGLDVVVLPAAASATMCNRELAASLAAHWENLSAKSRHQPEHKSRKDR
ncbi:MAG: ribonuclease P protein component [Xanthomonadales bacterium]|nr:ribonuclease P protein component [Xanthomonadales bacterium]NNL96233.1 ribonuclease P protein component [Xanthomonadales bacterium]